VKLLWVKAGKILPVDTGGKIRSYNLLRHLAKKHDVTLLSYYGGERDTAYEAAIAQELPGAETIYTGAADVSDADRAVEYARRMFSPAPFAVSKFAHPLVRRSVQRWIDEKRCDIALCDFLAPSLNFPSRPSLPSVLFQHNVESSLWDRRAQTESSLLRKMVYKVEAAKMQRYERETIQRFHHVIAVSDHDRQLMETMDPSCEITVVPTGVDTEKYLSAPPSTSKPQLVVFTGSMDWEPNIDAVTYFCSDIWPRILSEYPEARFQVVGRDPRPSVRKLATSSVEITGTVPSVDEYLRRATVVVVPLRAGGGTRLKIFEAMATGKAVVSTSVGAEGLDVTHGQDLILADNATTFADSILSLLRHDELRHGYEKAAAALAKKYDWSNIAVQFEDALLRAKARYQGRETGRQGS
jgi:glycosyltransferase involved in cell wall biosynthesis